jgi:hypothetical protein
MTMLQRYPTIVMTVKVNIPHPPPLFLHPHNHNPPNLPDRIAESASKFVIKLIHRSIIPKLTKLDKISYLFVPSTTLLDCCPIIWRLRQKK